jgi:hypothetical protein
MTHRGSKHSVDMNAFTPEIISDTSAPPKGVIVSPAQHALEEIKRQTGIVSRALHDIELMQAETKRLDELQEQYANLAARNSEMVTWLTMIKDALENHDNGELNARQFANEVDAAIKGWEAQ